MQQINILLFDDYTSLDALGPLEVLSRLKQHYEIDYFSLDGKAVKGSINTQILTRKISEIKSHDILLVPGGFATRALINDERFLSELSNLANASKIVLSVCTGSVLLACAGCLKGKRATSNKSSWEFVTASSKDVEWIKPARWVKDGKFYTSSGVAAGIDMALGFVAEIHGIKTARDIAKSMEYIWNEDRNFDPFA
ncbi:MULTISPECIES: DJ-1/PfpI family protein [unclassified Campylobacter]|uniref:DJ-1/PfpI family protein n=1 Tax=unclassified Campylobacter TaxID=2593542 RepID=UPI0014755556|nr:MULTISPECIES: DJ-1/PfpI family protein [unclassified Campylobacter]